jgi:hypothetical protein
MLLSPVHPELRTWVGVADRSNCGHFLARPVGLFRAKKRHSIGLKPTFGLCPVYPQWTGRDRLSHLQMRDRVIVAGFSSFFCTVSS